MAMVAIGFVAQPWSVQPADAAPPGSAFDPGLIISDSVFFDFGALNLQQIQAVLDSKVSDCRATDPAIDCLKNYKIDIPETAATAEGDVGPCKAIAAKAGATAAEVIYTIANACGINPKVLIVTLQKEQGLVTSTKPTEYMYRAAMGFGCPDSDPGICGKVYTGLFNQLYRAAKQFRWYGNPAGSFTYWKPGRTVAMRYNPKSSCGTKSFELKSQATANLYYYTPYTPNDAALSNLYGTGDSCSAYGNRNFWRVYHDWFGSPIGGGYLLKAAGAETYLIVDKLKYRVADTRIQASLRPLGPVGEVSQAYLDSFVTSGDIYQLVKHGTTGTYYLLVDGLKYSLPDCSMAQQYGLSCDLATVLTDSQLTTFVDGGVLTRLVQTSGGTKYWIENGTKRVVVDDLALSSVGGQAVTASPMVIEQVTSLAAGSALASELTLFGLTGTSDVVLASGGKAYRFVASLDSAVNLSKWFKKSGVRIELQAISSTLTSETVRGFVSSDQGETFVLTSAGKLKVSDVENWTDQVVSLPAAVLSAIPTVEGSLAAPAVVTSAGNKYSYFVQGAERRVVTSAAMTARFLDLIDQPKSIVLPQAAINTVTNVGTGFAPGTIVKANGSTTFYLVDGLTQKVQLTSAAQASNVSKSTAFTFDKSELSKLQNRTGFSSIKVSCLGDTYLVDQGVLHPISPEAVKEFPGLPYVLAASTCAAMQVASKPVGQFMRDSKGILYLVQDGKRSRISSWAHFATLRADGPGYIQATDYFAAKIPVSGTAPATVQLASTENTPSGVFGAFTFVGSVPEVVTPTPTPTPTPVATPSPTPTPTVTPTPTPTGQAAITYTVKSGDTLNAIAAKFSVTVASLQSYNNITNPRLLRIGQILKIPGAVAATPTPTPTPTSEIPAESETVVAEVEYRVQSGDTLWSIAAKFGVTLARLQEYNSISNAAYIRVGQLLKIPTSTSETVGVSQPEASAEPVIETYTVKSGDTLWGIARKFGVSSTALAALNNINNSNYIKVGQVLKIPS
jgi:LysM repeat protein